MGKDGNWTNLSSKINYVNTDEFNFTSGFYIGGKTNTKDLSGDILIRQNGKFQPVKIKGEVLINYLGATSIQPKVISDNNINDLANIKLRKTNLQVDEEQINYNGNDGLIKIKDIYVRNTGDTIDGDLNIQRINQDNSKNTILGLYTNGRLGGQSVFQMGESKLKNFKIYYQPRDDSMSFIGSNQKHPTFTMFNDGNVAIGKKINSRLDVTTVADELLHVHGNTKVDGKIIAKTLNVLPKKEEKNVQGWRNSVSNMRYVNFKEHLTMFEEGFLMNNKYENDDSGDANILIRNNGVYRSKVVTGDVRIDNEGEILIENEKIEDKHIKIGANINMGKTNFNVNTDQLTYTPNTGKIFINDIYLKNDGDTIKGDLTVKKDLDNITLNLYTDSPTFTPFF